MSRIPVKIKIKETRTEIQTEILKQIVKKLDTALVGAYIGIKKRIVEAVSLRIRSSPEYSSLISGQLQGEFGLDDSKNRVDSILNLWLDSIDLFYIPVAQNGKKLVGGYKLTVIDDSFKDVINTPGAIVNSKGGDVPWLEWLLLAGDALLVGGYTSDFTLPSVALTFSRSGQALMLPGGGWRVPSTFSGTRKNNWVTRALIGIESEISVIMKEEIEKKL